MILRWPNYQVSCDSLESAKPMLYSALTTGDDAKQFNLVHDIDAKSTLKPRSSVVPCSVMKKGFLKDNLHSS